MTGFNPRPSFLTGESMLMARQSRFRPFQSTPVISDGRIFPGAQPSNHRSSGFNPRPSFLTGESRHFD